MGRAIVREGLLRLMLVGEEVAGIFQDIVCNNHLERLDIVVDFVADTVVGIALCPVVQIAFETLAGIDLMAAVFAGHYPENQNLCIPQDDFHNRFGILLGWCNHLVHRLHSDEEVQVAGILQDFLRYHI